MQFDTVRSYIDGDDSYTTYNNYPVNLKVLVKRTETNSKGEWINYEVVEKAVITYDSGLAGRCSDVRSDLDINPYVELVVDRDDSSKLELSKKDVVSKLVNRNIEYGVIDYISYNFENEFKPYIDQEAKENNLNKKSTHDLTILRQRFIVNKMNSLLAKYSMSDNDKARN